MTLHTTRNIRAAQLTSRAIRDSLINSPYAWPGGYPRYGITSDGEALCCECCNTEYKSIGMCSLGDGWQLIADDVNWEDPGLYCSHCGDRIESAYAEA